MADLAVYFGLFLVALLAATIFPAQSEALVAGLLLTGYAPVSVLTVASLGNISGAVLNWLLGRGIARFRTKSWFPVSAAALDRAETWYRRYGKWSLLMSWVPIVGDPLTVMAGVLREPLGVFLVLVSIGKVGRYLVIVGIALEFS